MSNERRITITEPQSHLTFDKNNDFDLSTREKIYAAAQFCIKTKLAGDTFLKIKDNETRTAAVCSALLLIYRAGLNYKAFSNMYYLNGSIEFYGYTMNAIAKNSPDYISTDYFFVNTKGEKICFENKNLMTDVEACVYIVNSKKNEKPKEYFFSKKMAQDAGLINRDTYKKYLPDMLMNKAKARALLNEFPEVFYGLNFKEANELKEIQKESIKTVSPIKNQNKNDLIMERLNKSNEEQEVWDECKKADLRMDAYDEKLAEKLENN